MSTCSPICGISARITEAAAPNFRMSSPSTSPAAWAARPGKVSQACTDGQSCIRMKPTGRRLRTIQSGWVMIWKRLIQVMPWVTSGITATALTM